MDTHTDICTRRIQEEDESNMERPKESQSSALGQQQPSGNLQVSAQQRVLTNIGNKTNSSKSNIDHSNEQQQQPIAKQRQPETNPLVNRRQFIKSSSSPSSLTTHKFGLRPTPSPPRLIIDHQTGDIVESYPANPVYLRTYQPLTPTDDEETPVSSQRVQIGPLRATAIGRDEAEDLSEHNEHGSQHSLGADSTTISEMSTSNRLNSSRQPTGSSSAAPRQFQQEPFQEGQVIPPPHSGKVYFAPPDTGTSSEPLPGPLGRPVAPLGVGGDSSLKRALDKLHQLPSSERHDIAIVTEPDGPDYGDRIQTRPEYVDSNKLDPIDEVNLDGPRQRSQPIGKVQGPSEFGSGRQRTVAQRADGRAILYAPNTPPSPLIVATSKQLHRSRSIRASPIPVSVSASASTSNQPSSSSVPATNNKRNTLNKDNNTMANQAAQDSKQTISRQHSSGSKNGKKPVAELGLYNFFFNLIVFLAFILSSLIIYFLSTQPLNLDCTSFRPTYTYVSLICCSVNLITICIFTFFYCCSGITRTLYANISASAFIVTIYSILVALNLALAIVFFLVNTCNSEKLHKTHSLLAYRGQLIAQSDAENQDENQATNEYQKIFMQDHSFRLNPLASFDSVSSSYNRLTISEQRLAKVLEELEFLEDFEEGKELAREKPRLLIKRHNQEDDDGSQPPVVIDDESPPDTSPRSSPPATTTAAAELDYYNEQQYAVLPQMSPIEAFWEYLKSLFDEFRQKFHRFLVTYDLKFLGSLHALCAICFQYLAMKVAVLRSYYTSLRPHSSSYA